MGNPESEIASFQASDSKTLQSQTNLLAENRISINGLALVHGRLVNSHAARFSECP
jgi:hypothetical protein